MHGMVVTERDCTGWSECLLWLWQRETAQDGVSAWYQDGVNCMMMTFIILYLSPLCVQ
jgi:hypothetical protein